MDRQAVNKRGVKPLKLKQAKELLLMLEAIEISYSDVIRERNGKQIIDLIQTKYIVSQGKYGAEIEKEIDKISKEIGNEFIKRVRQYARKLYSKQTKRILNETRI